MPTTFIRECDFDGCISTAGLPRQDSAFSKLIPAAFNTGLASQLSLVQQGLSSSKAFEPTASFLDALFASTS